MIQFSDVSLMRGSKVLLRDANAVVYPGHKAGLIGANGCGKSTLFALIKGELHTEQGDFNIPKNWQIVSVAQETPAVDRSALDYVIDGEKQYRKLQTQQTSHSIRPTAGRPRKPAPTEDTETRHQHETMK